MTSGVNAADRVGILPEFLQASSEVARRGKRREGEEEEEEEEDTGGSWPHVVGGEGTGEIVRLGRAVDTLAYSRI